MTAKEWATKINSSKLECSLLVLTSKQSFIDWLKSFMIKQGLGAYNVYFPEGDAVWLIPKIEQFSKPGSYDEFLDEIKPRLLLAELHNFGAVEADFEYPITKETFDKFFDLTLRNEATPISVLFK